MAASPRHPVRRHRDIDGLLDEDAGVALGLQLSQALVERVAHSRACTADTLARLGLGCGRKSADLAVGQRERRSITGVRKSHGLQLVKVPR